MRIQIETPVQPPPEVVWAGFSRDLFEQLSPPFPPVELIRYDGSQPGDRVQVRLNFLLFKQDWISRITEQRTTDAEIYFIDEGEKLPFFLRYWRHRHRLVRDGAGTRLIDDIEYRTPSLLTDLLFYPILWGQFWYRRPIYRRVFGATPPAT
jgi:ligand-binding SRPBCC domain-containing protein